MERLTRKDTIVVRGKETAACNYENDDCNDQCRYGTCRWQEKANMILKKYEDTGLTPREIMKLKERDTAKVPEVFDGHWYKCPTCGVYAGGLKGNFCHVCGQRLKWED